MPRPTTAMALFAAFVSCAGCNLTDPASADGAPGRDGGQGRETGDAARDDALDSRAADGGRDGDLLSGPGALVLVVQEVELLTDRLCDLDGDGEADNAVADLGSPSAGIFTGALNAVLAANLGPTDRMLLHFPRVADRAGPNDPSATLLVYGGRDTDVPTDGGDDFSGEEPFYAESQYLDGCGEPLYSQSGIAIDNGTIAFDASAIPVDIDDVALPLRGGRGEGVVAPGGRALELTVCGYSTFGDLGLHPGFGDAGTSFLEQLMIGGNVFGVPSVPGLTFDVDADGDGLESLVLDDEGRIESCVDGDSTVILGPECWSDERMADGISFVCRFEAVGARFAGREPAWEYTSGESCDGAPPETSLFDGGFLYRDGPCAEMNEPCDPLSRTPCCDEEASCSGANRVDYRCLVPCIPDLCDYGELVGCCRSGGICYPAGFDPEAVDCEVGAEGCRTDYGIDEGTLCIDVGEPRCVERCSPSGRDSGCSHGNDRCIPLPDRSGGVCIAPI